MYKQIKVKPNSLQQIIEEALDGSLTIRLKSPPVDGKANKELIEILAKNLMYPSLKLESSQAYPQKIS